MQIFKQISGLTSKVLFALAAVVSVFMVVFVIAAFFLFSWLSQSFQFRLNTPNPVDIINESQDIIQVAPTNQSSSSSSSIQTQRSSPVWQNFQGQEQDSETEAD